MDEPIEPLLTLRLQENWKGFLSMGRHREQVMVSQTAIH